MKSKDLRVKLDGVINEVEESDVLMACCDAFMFNKFVDKYSIKNRQLLLEQLMFNQLNEDLEATEEDFASLYFLGFKEATKQGKKIKRGSKAYYIYAPVIKKTLNSENVEVEELENCFLIPVFCSLDFE